MLVLAMDVSNFLENVQDLSDLELATLLCLVAKEHCLVETADELVDDLASELALIVSEVFGLSYAVLSVEDLDSIDVFSDAILEQNEDGFEEMKHPGLGNSDHNTALGSKVANLSMRAASLAPSSDMRLDTRKVVNVVIMKDFNLASHDVQIQTMEVKFLGVDEDALLTATIQLVRRLRIFSRTTVHAVSDVFLMMGLISTSSKDIKLSKHLVCDLPSALTQMILISAE